MIRIRDLQTCNKNSREKNENYLEIFNTHNVLKILNFQKKSEKNMLPQQDSGVGMTSQAILAN